jgi:hypothetical protein
MFSSKCTKERHESLKCTSNPSSWQSLHPVNCSSFFSKWNKCAKEQVAAKDIARMEAETNAQIEAKSEARAQPKPTSSVSYYRKNNGEFGLGFGFDTNNNITYGYGSGYTNIGTGTTFADFSTKSSRP